MRAYGDRTMRTRGTLTFRSKACQVRATNSADRFGDKYGVGESMPTLRLGADERNTDAVSATERRICVSKSIQTVEPALWWKHRMLVRRVRGWMKTNGRASLMRETMPAVKEALVEEMQADERVFIMGEDIAVYGGAFKVTEGMLEQFGPERIIDTPIAEAGMVGAAVGAAAVPWPRSPLRTVARHVHPNVQLRIGSHARDD